MNGGQPLARSDIRNVHVPFYLVHGRDASRYRGTNLDNNSVTQEMSIWNFWCLISNYKVYSCTYIVSSVVHTLKGLLSLVNGSSNQSGRSSPANAVPYQLSQVNHPVPPPSQSYSHATTSKVTSHITDFECRRARINPASHRRSNRSHARTRRATAKDD